MNRLSAHLNERFTIPGLSAIASEEDLRQSRIEMLAHRGQRLQVLSQSHASAGRFRRLPHLVSALGATALGLGLLTIARRWSQESRLALDLSSTALSLSSEATAKPEGRAASSARPDGMAPQPQQAAA